MMKTRRITLTLTAAVLSALLLQPVAFGQTPGQPMQGHTMAPGATMAGGMDMMATMKHMSDKMAAMPMTGKTDVDFAKMMRLHHQGAIQMAEVELRDGKEPAMRKMAQEIIKAQKKEIAEFDRFLAKQGRPDPKAK
jgi:uncharacterized protein (DUF305 family)